MSKKADKKPSAPKADTKKADTPAAASETTPAPEKKAKSGGTSARPISYFSSVATDDYRDGWDGIFAGKKAAAKSQPQRKAKSKARAKGPIVLELSADDLNDDLRGQLEAAFKAKAKQKRLAYDKRAAAGQVSWQLTCKLAS